MKVANTENFDEVTQLSIERLKGIIVQREFMSLQQALQEKVEDQKDKLTEEDLAIKREQVKKQEMIKSFLVVKLLMITLEKNLKNDFEPCKVDDNLCIGSLAAALDLKSL